MPRRLNTINNSIAGGGINLKVACYQCMYRSLTIQVKAASSLSHLYANNLCSRVGRTTSVEGGIVMLELNGMYALQGLGLEEAPHHQPNDSHNPYLHVAHQPLG
jgi:hypothetical protein